MPTPTQDFESRQYRRPWMTWVLIGICVCVYLSMTEIFRFSSDPMQMNWVRWGAVHPVRIWSGEIWRLVTAIFLHGNVIHLALNAIVLFQIGRLLEPIIGASRFLFIFLVSGIVSFALSLAVNTSISVGSSGAVFGLVGALLGLSLVLPRELTDRGLLRALLWFVAINVTFGFLINFGFHFSVAVDNVAHLAGLATGFMLGIAFLVDTPWFKMFKGKTRLRRQALSTVFLIGSYGLLFGSVGLCIRPTFSKEYHYQMGLQALRENDISGAEKAASALVKIDEGLGFAHLLRGRIAVQERHDDHARALFQKALTEIADDPQKTWQVIFANPYQTTDATELLFVDERSHAMICQLMSQHVGDAMSATMFNDCAWLLLMASDKKVHNERQALQWAKRASRISKGTSPEILHTLAESYAQNGQFDEAIMAMDRAILQKSKAMNFFVHEKQRFEKLAFNVPPKNSN